MIRVSIMKDHESPEASQEDPVVMYLIVHESLNMSIGKTAAQSAHASQMLTLKYFTMKEASITLQKRMQPLLNAPPPPEEMVKLKEAYVEMSRPLSIFGEWLNSSYRKVVLRASDKEWAKLKEEFKDSMVMVVDAGLTEIASGSETFIGIWPMRRSQRPKILQRLQVLK
jgi:PTH2 family peptidyl-tRNA hydrolase